MAERSRRRAAGTSRAIGALLDDLAVGRLDHHTLGIDVEDGGAVGGGEWRDVMCSRCGSSVTVCALYMSAQPRAPEKGPPSDSCAVSFVSLSQLPSSVSANRNI